MKERIADRIRSEGALDFADYMAAALYDPQLGYYARGIRQVGKHGDFFTSVSVGPLFGQLLARRFLTEWQRIGRPDRWRITECGAHDGRLALDILEALATLDASASAAVEYAIPEPLDHLRQAQRETLAAHAPRLRHVARVAELDPAPGVVFGNELLDALPCRRIEWRDGRWQECRVGVAADGNLEWRLAGITDAALESAAAQLGTAFPDGYRTEVRTTYHELMAPLAASLSRGAMIWIDYGFAREDYYHPGRTTGTLRTYRRHQAGEDPLEHPGEMDISAHVDFTAVAEAAGALGGRPQSIHNQGAWLTRLAREWLIEQEGQPRPDGIRQFQTLTHPGQLGRSFQVMEIEWGEP